MPKPSIQPDAATALQVYLLGTVDFDAVLHFQRRLHYEIAGDRNQAALILCEHPPLITVGRQGSRAHIRFDPNDLHTWRWPIRWVNRGGGCMLHLPGQLALYSILPLDRWQLSISSYLDRLSDTIKDLLDDFKLHGQSNANHTGVWLGQRMVAGLGIAVRDWVSYYGAYVNLHPDLEFYRHIRCDRSSAEPMTSLVRERRGPVRPALLRERLLEHFRTRFPFDRVSLFSDHPVLQGYLQRCQEPKPTVHTPS